MNSKGFTIVEVLVSLIILSIITVISSNILQSSLDSERDATEHLNSIKELNLSSSIMRRDIRQIANIPSRDFFGNSLYGTLIGKNDSQGISFSTRIKSLSNEVSPIKRVEYILENDALVRRQYFSSNPYDQSAYTESKLLIDLSELRFSFMYENKWHNSWPINLITSKKIPTIIQEQNSYPGITNKLLSKKSTIVCVAYDGLERFFPKEKIVKTGNPVRASLLSIHVKEKIQEANKLFQLKMKTTTVLVLGGSLGARKINQLIEANISFFKEQKVQVLWQCGKLYYDDYKKHAQKENFYVHAFINKMDLAYAAADIIISRAGASSVSELCIVGKPTIFIPSPNVAEDHQTKNAKSIVDKHAALMIKESDLETFPVVFESLIKDTGKQESLSENIKELALPSATKDIVDTIEKLLKK